MIERKIESVTDAGHPDIGGDIKYVCLENTWRAKRREVRGEEEKKK